MLEIFGIMALCGVNRKNAVVRGASPGKYTVLTILLWVGPEFLGAIIGQLAELGIGAYVLALVFAAVGGFLSYKLARGNGKQAANAVQPTPNQSPQTQGIPRTLLVAAARAVFNNPFSTLVFDPEDKLWKEPIQQELALLVKGGADSVSVIEELLAQCAGGYGGSLSDSWWYGSVWAVKAAAMLPKREAAGMMVRLLQRDSRIAEWFTYVQSEASRQLGVIGDRTELPALLRVLEKPLSMSPVSEIEKAVKQIESSQAQIAAVAPDPPAAPETPSIPSPLTAPETQEQSEPESIPKKKKQSYLIIALVAAVVIVILGVTIYFLTREPAVNTAKLLDKGIAYLDDGEYDKALEQFRTIIDTDEEVTDAYIGAADAYIALEQTDRALRILEKGYKLTESARIERKLNALNEGEALAPEAAGKTASEPPDKPAPKSGTASAAAADPNERGNTNGNIVNGALAAIKGDWIFYISDGAIYKARIGGTVGTLLTDGNCSCLNVISDWVYYVEDNRIKKIKTDGAEKTQISDDFAVSINVIGDWIYYTNCGGSDEYMDMDEPGIHKMKTDGSEKEWIGYDLCYDASVVGDWVYYLNDSYMMYKIRTDGSDRTQLSYEPCSSVNVVGDLIYYVNANNNNIYKMKLDGSDDTRINSAYIGNANVSGDWIYYTNFSFMEETLGEDTGVYRMRLDGSDQTQLTNDKALIPNVVGPWIHYLSFGGDYTVNFCKVRTDGTQQEILTQ